MIRESGLPENWKIRELASRDGSSAVGAVNRLYLGDEFCERRLPSERELLTGLRPELRRTLVTSPATDVGVKRIQQLLEAWFKTGHSHGELEIVINDLGVFEATEPYAGLGLRRILGRILTGRYTRANAYSTLPDSFLEFAVEQKVIAVEFNSPIQVLESGARCKAVGLKVHLHWPFEYFTSTRFCPVAGGFSASVSRSVRGCSRECERQMGVLSSKEFPEFHVLGNTHFVRNAAGGEALELDRLIDHSIKLQD